MRAPPQKAPIAPLEELNDTELWEVARNALSSAYSRSVRIKRSVSRERIIQLIETNQLPNPDELVGDSRLRLEQWVAKNWVSVNSQLPCTGADRGKCTKYPCPEIRHLSCYVAAKPHMI